MMVSVFKGPLNGYKVFGIFSLFFIVIIAVNIKLAVSAVETFPGLEVDNSYVASQTFDADRAAQLALGWTVSAHVHLGNLRLSITDPNGAPVEAQSVAGTFGRATSTRDDQTPNFVFDGIGYVAPVTVAPGNWNFRLEAVAKDGTPFHQRLVVIVD